MVVCVCVCVCVCVIQESLCNNNIITKKEIFKIPLLFSLSFKIYWSIGKFWWMKIIWKSRNSETANLIIIIRL